MTKLLDFSLLLSQLPLCISVRNVLNNRIIIRMVFYK